MTDQPTAVVHCPHVAPGQSPCTVCVELFRAHQGLKALAAERDKLQAFKNWTHQFLDAHGVPHHPPGTHGAEGCRIGDRMDWLMEQLRRNTDQAVRQAGEVLVLCADLQTAVERIEALEAALRPFTVYADENARRMPGNMRLMLMSCIFPPGFLHPTLDDCRRAAELLNRKDTRVDG